METSRRRQNGDAFARALKETFGEHASLAKIEAARVLYARYRTDDVLERLKGIATDKKDESDKP